MHFWWHDWQEWAPDRYPSLEVYNPLMIAFQNWNESVQESLRRDSTTSIQSLRVQLLQCHTMGSSHTTWLAYMTEGIGNLRLTCSIVQDTQVFSTLYFLSPALNRDEIVVHVCSNNVVAVSHWQLGNNINKISQGEECRSVLIVGVVTQSSYHGWC
jgi:hypothetical protein